MRRKTSLEVAFSYNLHRLDVSRCQKYRYQSHSKQLLKCEIKVKSMFIHVWVRCL